MTTIILTIIGILLAAAAALMVIFYGGDAFNSGSTGAAANSIQNAGTNVISAVAMYKVDFSNANPADMTTLTTGGKYLKENPSLSGVGAQSLAPVGTRTVYQVPTVPALICLRINNNLSLSAAQQATAVPTTQVQVDAAPKMACSQATSTSVGTFYAVS